MVPALAEEKMSVFKLVATSVTCENSLDYVMTCMNCAQTLHMGPWRLCSIAEF